MKQISISVPEKILDFYDKLVELKLYPSRNEAMRYGLKDFVAKESAFISSLDNNIDKLHILHKKYVEFTEKLQNTETYISTGNFING